ncbi:MAG: 4Fe-4S binding protein [Gemmatimonadetes bacterium]|nr:4Fe-4S binding protein [Gemmatimonadota bacterium]
MPAALSSSQRKPADRGQAPRSMRRAMGSPTFGPGRPVPPPSGSNPRRGRMRSWCVAVAALGLLLPIFASAQQSSVDATTLQTVFPAATRIGTATGSPPVYQAYGHDPATGQEVLLGYVFLTSDWPPQEKGYSGTIQSLVGVDKQGTITGMRVIEYHESLQSSRGDFLRGAFETQFSGKRIGDSFRIRRDVDNVSGATITSGAAARSIRDAARRVAAVYLNSAKGELTREEIEQLDWPDLVIRGLGDRILGSENGVLQIDVQLVPIVDEAMGRVLLGDEAWDRAVRKLGKRATERRLWMIGMAGGFTGLVGPQTLSAIRGADTLRFTLSDFALAGQPRSGKAEGELRNIGLIAVDPSLDPEQPFTWRLDLGRFPPFLVQHGSKPELVAATAAPEAPSATPGSDPADEQPAPGVAPAGVETAEAQASDGDASDVARSAVAPVLDPLPVDFSADTDETVLRRTLASTDWLRVGLVVFLLALASAAFFSKWLWLRWAALAATLAIMGMGSAQWAAPLGGGGFLSVSHITAAIKVGPRVFLDDLPLLLLVAFTVVTTLLWGRVFCGYLCPFGALQDFLEHLVPRKLRRKLPHPVHESGLFIKYGVLGVILVPVMAGSDRSIFQYFEPFGTVFFWSSSTALWLIAGAILIGSAIIPRFYCRYLCPLGASLALASLISPFRIKRVQQCTVCTVCEHSCPTGAIRRDSIDFRECVRCNVCEVKLIQRGGVCRHDLDKVAHLIQLKRGHRHASFQEPQSVNGD